MRSIFNARYLIGTIFVYFDRFLALTVPLYVLQIMEDNSLYTTLEYVLALSVLVSTFWDLGLSNYILFYNRRSGDRDATTKLSLVTLGYILIAQLILIFFVLIAAQFQFEWIESKDIYLIGIALARSSSICAVGILYQIMIVNDKAMIAPLLSISQWLIVFIAINTFPSYCNLNLVASMALPLVIIMLISIVRRDLFYSAKSIAEVTIYVRESFRWGWPILISTLLTVGVLNLARAYGYDELDETNQISFNYWMRVLIVVQLAHSTILSMSSLDIYESNMGGVIVSNFKSYIKALFVASSIVALYYHFSHGIEIIYVPLISVFGFCACLGYILFRCLGSYFEAYMNRDGRTLAVLKISVISGGLFLLMILFTRPSSVEGIAIIMMLSALFHMFCIAWCVINNLTDNIKS